MIYNPLAGPVNLLATIEHVAEYWQRRGWRVDVQATKAAGHATTLAQQAVLSGAELVLAAGGDGTLGEVANGLAGTETVLAPLPGGTANSFAKELGLPRPGLFNRQHLLEATKLLAAGQVQRMDMGFTFSAGKEGKTGSNGRFWILWAGTGADGYLVNQLEPRPKWAKRMGPLGYALQGLALAPSLPDMHALVDIDGQLYEDDFILVVISNCRMYGGEVILSPNASLDDGQFEVWLFRGKGLPQTIRHITLTIRGDHRKDTQTQCIHGRTVIIHTKPTMPCQTDGDPAGYTPLHCEIRPGALRLLVPPTTPPGLFGQPGTPL